jgi:hypothetical protein
MRCGQGGFGKRPKPDDNGAGMRCLDAGWRGLLEIAVAPTDGLKQKNFRQ